jgi:hypothetical protein
MANSIGKKILKTNGFTDGKCMQKKKIPLEIFR